MVYRYVAYTNDKKLVRGAIESSTMEMAEDSLYKAGFQRIIQLREGASSVDWRKLLFGTPKVNKQALLDFTTELAVLMQSGLNLMAALKMLEKQTSDRSVRKVLSRLEVDLKGGMPLNKAMARHPEVFSETYCSMISANEKSGTLDSGLRQIAKELAQRIATESQMRRTLIQPTIVTVVSVAVVLLLTKVVLPPLVDLFRQLGAELPLITRMLISFTDFVNAYLGQIVIVVLALGLAIFILYRTGTGRQSLDRILLKVPVIGDIVTWYATARFSQTVANLLKSGVSLPESIGIVRRTVGNAHMRTGLDELRRELIQGKALSRSLGSIGLFPQLLVEMVTVGESTGTLESALGTVADYAETKLQRKLGKLTALLEPALTLVMGVGVGIIAVAFISALYGMMGDL